MNAEDHQSSPFLKRIALLERLERQTDEKLLLNIAKNGPPERDISFAVLYNRYHARMLRFIQKFINDYDLAEDIFHESMMKLITPKNRRIKVRNFSAWFHKVVVNLVFAGIKSERLQWQRLPETLRPEFDPSAQNGHTPEESLLDNERDRMIRRCLSTLPEKFRIVFVMRVDRQLSTRVISEILHISPRTVTWRLKRSVDLIRVYMKNQFDT